MGKTYRGDDREKIKKRRKYKPLPKQARRINKNMDLRKKEEQAIRRGRYIDSKYYTVCYGKIRYRTTEEASGKTLGKLLVPYKCNYCIYYHVGRRHPLDPDANSLYKSTKKKERERIRNVQRARETRKGNDSDATT